ncbi:reprolysin-like metallopeptidase [Engelhardtia mirabilis]|uniref:reprolysin-like metallopeptidase n=1 Tax=Engelhardtia mirabilis TaxID=2528011 RepID=UPI00119FF96E
MAPIGSPLPARLPLPRVEALSGDPWLEHFPVTPLFELPAETVTIRVLFVYLGQKDERLAAACEASLSAAQAVFERSLRAPGWPGLELQFAGAVAAGLRPGPEPGHARFAGVTSVNELLLQTACQCSEDARFVAAARRAAEADLVCMVTAPSPGQKKTGTAFVFEQRPDAGRFGFAAVTAAVVADPRSVTLAHELGHLFGCLHEVGPQVCNSPFGAHPQQSLRFARSTHEYTTIMGGSGRRLPVFSSPLLWHAGADATTPPDQAISSTPQGPGALRLGTPVGGCAGADNATIIRFNAETVAEYYP